MPLLAAALTIPVLATALAIPATALVVEHPRAADVYAVLGAILASLISLIEARYKGRIKRKTSFAISIKFRLSIWISEILIKGRETFKPMMI
jgi:hypothetical protein